jgi:hypothetical protein
VPPESICAPTYRIKLDGVIDKADGTKLKICKPDAAAPPAPLFEPTRGAKENT